MEIPFIGGAYAGRSSNLNAQVCQNWYPIIDQQDGKSVMALQGTPGLKLFCSTGVDNMQARGSIVWNDSLYAVFGPTLWKITTGGVATNVGTLSTSTGRVYMAGGTAYLCIVDGTYGYYQDTDDTALTQITDIDFPTPTSLCYLDGFFLVTKDDTDEMYISSSEDPSTWEGLDFASAEDSPDDILMAHVYKRHLIAFGEETIEVFYNTGDASFPFTRVAGAVIPVGIGAAASAASGPEGMFFLDDQRRVRTMQGYEAVIISTEQIEYHFRAYSTVSDAIGYTYTQEGHSFYVLTFPTESRTWCFDISTGIWHTRSSGPSGGRHRSAWHQWFSGKNLVGDEINGRVYELDLDTYTDDGRTIRAIRAAQVVQAHRNIVFHSRLELEFEAGVGRLAESFIGSGGGELIVNGDMELNSNWNPLVEAGDTTGQSSDQAHGGAYSWEFGFLSEAGEYGIISDVFTTETGETYFGGAWIYPTEVDEVTVQIYKGDGSMGLALDEEHTGLTLNAWNYIEISYTESAGGASARLSFTGAAGGSGGDEAWYVDDVSLKNSAGRTRTVTEIDPQAMLDWSDDGGHTWSNEHWRPIGKIGEYTKRAIWRRLGRSRNRIYRLTITDPVKRVLISAHLEAEQGSY